MKLIKYSLILLCCTILSACSSPSALDSSNTANSSTYVFKDDLNRDVSLTLPLKNVVSLYGSYSEIWTLAGGKLVGITDDVVQRDILDDSTIQRVGSTKTPNIELILSLQPDLVILNPNISEQLDIADVLKNSGIATAFFDVEVFDDYLNMLKITTDMTDNPTAYQTYGTNLIQKIQSTLTNTNEGEGKKVLLLRAFSSNVKARGTDNMTGQMLKQFGTTNITDLYPSLLEELSSEVIIEQDPDYIFVTTMGNKIDQAIENLEDMILNHPAYQDLTAIKNKQVYILPKELFHYKPNQRWDEAYDYLAQIFQP